MGIKAKASAIKMAALNAILSTGIALVASFAINKIVTAIDNFIHREEKIAEKAETAKNNIDDLKNSFDELESSVNDVKERYAELSQYINQTNGKNSSLSTDEYQEFLDLSNQLAELFPSLIKGYDENGNAILNLSGNIDTIVSSLDDLIKKEQEVANQEILDNLPDVYKEMAKEVKKAKKSLKDSNYSADVVSELMNESDVSESDDGIDVKINTDIDINDLIAEINKALIEAGYTSGEYITNGFQDANGFKNLSIYLPEGFKNGDSFKDILGSYLTNVYEDVETYTDKIQSKLDEFKQYLYIYFSTESEFTKLSDNPELQQTIQNLIYKTDWLEQANKNGISTGSWSKELENWLTDNYVTAIANIDDEEIKNSLSQLFEPDIRVDDLLALATKIQQYFNDNGIKISLDFILNGDLNGTVQNTKNSLDNNITDISNGDSDEYKKLEKYTKDFSIDQVNTWLEVTKGAKNATEAIELYEAELQEIQSENSSNFLNSEDNIEAIDEYKEKISDLSGYLEKINSNHKLSAEEMAKLITTYGITADSVDEYREKIINLMNDTASNSEIMTALADAIANCNDEAMKSQLQSLYDNLQNINIEAQNGANSFGDLDTAISTLQNKAQLLRDLKESIKDVGYIDSSNLDDIISTYPELTDKVAEYNTGLITSQQLFDSLTEAYETDAKNYALAVAEKLKYNEQFYNNVVENIPTWLSDLASSYGIDFKNYKNYCEAKLALDKEYNQKRIAMESAKATSDKLSEIATSNTSGSQLRDQAASLDAYDNYLDAKKEYEDLQKIVDGVGTTLSTTLKLNTDWNSFGKDLNSGSSDKNSNSKQEIDWLEQSLTVLQAKVDELQTTFDNTTGIDNQIKALNNLNSALKDLKNGYKTAYDTYKSRYNKAIKSLGKSGSSIKKKIESGKSFDLKEYSSKTAEKIQDAIDAYNDMIEAQEKVNSLAKEIYDNKTIEKSKLYQEDYENQLDVINEKLEDQTLTAGEKNKLLDDQLKLQIAINKELRKQAEYSGDYETIDKLNQEDKNNKLQTKLNEIQNDQDENQKLIDRYKEQLENTTLTTSEIDDVNKALQHATDEDFRYQMESEIATIDSTAWKNYITKLKKKYKETKLSDEDFIKKHIEEISNYFDNTDMAKIYQEYLNAQIDNKSTNYETYKTARGYRIQANENDITDINNAIESKGGRGTQEQYEQLQKLYQSNLGYWEEQKKEAEKMLLTAKEGTAEWDKWNNELQECEDNIYDCNEKIKECYSSILKLPLNDVEDSLDEISKRISDIDDQISEKDTLISAANYLIDQQIEGYDLLKESIQDQIDALQEEKSLREANLNVQKAEYNLEKIRNQKNVKTFREGIGWTYEANMDDVKSAQEDYDNAVYDRKITLLEHQIDLYDDEIEKLNDIKDQWNSIVEDIQNIMDFNEALLYDSNFAQKVLTNDYSLIAAISGEYRNLLETKSVYEDQQDDYEKLQDEINEVVELYEREGITYEEAKKRIHSAIQIYYPEILSKYENESETLDRIIEQKLDDSEVSTSTNEAMLESYQYFLGEMNDIFDELNDMLKRFETNTYDMVYSVNRSISNLQDNIQSAINAANALNSISSSSSKSKTNIIMGLTSIGKSHSGMELGTVRKNMDNGSGNNSDFKALCLSELEPDEMLRVLKIGENVLTPDQTNNVMSNFKNLANVKVPTLPLRNQEVNKSIEFNGDIVIQGVQDTNSFARSLKQSLPNALLQELYK
jgi:chromosome segregation ATPase